MAGLHPIWGGCLWLLVQRLVELVASVICLLGHWKMHSLVLVPKLKASFFLSQLNAGLDVCLFAHGCWLVGLSSNEKHCLFVIVWWF